MNRKIMPLLIILIISIGCLSLVSADNNTTDNINIEEDVDLANYIVPISITDNGIEFSDGFTGFCLDLSKDAISVGDKFTSSPTRNEEVENNVKMAIIAAYQTGNEKNIGNMVSQTLNGNKKYDIVNTTFNTDELNDDTIVVNISNTTKATFTFELLKSTNDGKSDCLAYKISTQKITGEDVLKAENNETEPNDTLTATENNTNTKDSNDIESNESNTKTQNVNETDDSTLNETNKTIVNKTNTVIINENNTTIINQKNVKVINKTNATPKNTTFQDNILKTVGNPIFLLVIVIIIVAVVAVAIRRKD